MPEIITTPIIDESGKLAGQQLGLVGLTYEHGEKHSGISVYAVTLPNTWGTVIQQRQAQWINTVLDQGCPMFSYTSLPDFRISDDDRLTFLTCELPVQPEEEGLVIKMTPMVLNEWVGIEVQALRNGQPEPALYDFVKQHKLSDVLVVLGVFDHETRDGAGRFYLINEGYSRFRRAYTSLASLYLNS